METISGGPSGASFVNSTPSPTQTLTSGATITFTLNFTTNKVETGTIIVNATLTTPFGNSPWTGPMSFTSTGPQTISGTSASQSFASIPIGVYTLTYISGAPSGVTLVNVTPSITQTLTTGSTLTFTLNFR